MVATASAAWKAGKNWEAYPLTQGRLLKKHAKESTRQAVQRTLPLQTMNTNVSIISRLVEVWEQLPSHIKDEDVEHVAKQKIGQWAANM